jgi:hypothetical protein
MLLAVLGLVVCAGLPAKSATDYFAVSEQNSAWSYVKVHIFSYDTVAASVTYRTTVTNATSAYVNMTVGLSAVPNYGFIIGHRRAPNVDRYTTANRTNWVSDLRIDMSLNTPGTFYDTAIRSGSALEHYCVGVAMLKDGKVFITSDRNQAGNRYYGLGDLTGLSGTVSAIFPQDANHLGNLAVVTGSGEQTLWDVTSTIEGTANRFVTCNRNINGTVMVYNSDGTYKGAITPVGTGVRALGVFKATAKGDLILQANNRGYNSLIDIRGIYVDDSRFDTAAFTKSHTCSGTYFNRGTSVDVDGLESGRIIVFGTVRGPGSVDKAGILNIFESTDGTTWTPVWATSLWLENAIGAPAGIGGETICGLYYTAPPAADAPAIVSVGASNVTSTTAGLVGNLTTGSMPVTVTCYWGTNDGANVAANWMTNDLVAVSALGYLTNSVSSLTPGKPYSFRYFASNATDTAWAVSSKSFVTPGAPTVDNGNGASGVGQTAAQLNGNILGGYPNPHVWIYWGTTDGGTDKNAWDLPVLDLGTRALGAFSTNQTGLLMGQTYWYRCYASNETAGAWALVSTNFTTDLPVLTISNAGVVEGALGTTTTAVFSVTLSAAHIQDVSVHVQTADNTATTNDTDYVAIPDTLLTLPAGMVSTQVVVIVNGDNRVEATETFRLNLSGVTHATLASAQATGTITNDDLTIYVRHGGGGATNGTDWANAYDTLQKALDAVAYDMPIIINAQASISDQAYAVCERTTGYAENRPMNVAFKGGWTDVDGTPVQTGMSAVRSATTNQPGIKLWNSNHSQPKTVLVHRFAFSDVSEGVVITAGEGDSYCDILLTLSNTTIRAQTNGVYVKYMKTNTTGSEFANVRAVNVDIVAGLGGAGHGIYLGGKWSDSSVGATGSNVSSLVSSNGCGVYFTAPGRYAGAMVSFSNVVVHGSTSHGIHLDATGATWYQPEVFSNIVRTALVNCTVVDNGGDGLHMLSATVGSYGNATNCIFANNGGQGINLYSPNNAFACAEGYNLFYYDGISTNGAPKTLDATDLEGDPLFYGKKSKPAPWYVLGSKSSPAWHSGSDNRNRGAYQTEMASQGTLLMLF